MGACIIEGQVTSDSTGLDGVQVSCDAPGNPTVYTSNNGYYLMAVLPGTYNFTFSRTEYETKIKLDVDCPDSRLIALIESLTKTE